MPSRMHRRPDRRRSKNRETCEKRLVARVLSRAGIPQLSTQGASGGAGSSPPPTILCISTPAISVPAQDEEGRHRCGRYQSHLQLEKCADELRVSCADRPQDRAPMAAIGGLLIFIILAVAAGASVAGWTFTPKGDNQLWASSPEQVQLWSRSAQSARPGFTGSSGLLSSSPSPAATSCG